MSLGLFFAERGKSDADIVSCRRFAEAFTGRFPELP